jgi:hypothetical protein
MGIFRLCTDDPTPDKIEALKLETMCSCKPLLNPLDFATKEDNIFCISNCMSDDSVFQKYEWLQHYYGDRVKFIHVQTAKGLWKKDYVDAVAKAKLDIMVRLGIEVYFDDDPAIINTMREIASKDNLAKNIKFLKYGTWVREYY